MLTKEQEQRQAIEMLCTDMLVPQVMMLHLQADSFTQLPEAFCNAILFELINRFASVRYKLTFCLP